MIEPDRKHSCPAFLHIAGCFIRRSTALGFPESQRCDSLQLFEHLGVVALILKSYQQGDIRQTDALVPQ